MKYIGEQYGFVVLRGEGDAHEYDSFIAAFARNGDRGALFRNVLALGLTADQVRWHAAHPGNRTACCW